MPRPRLDLMFYEDGTATVDFDAQPAEFNSVAHVVVEVAETDDIAKHALSIIYGSHVLESESLSRAGKETVLENIITKVFEAGLQRGFKIAAKTDESFFKERENVHL